MRWVALAALLLVAACQPNPPPSGSGPDKMPLFYARTLSDPNQLAGFSWTGQQVTTIPKASTVDSSPWLAIFRDASGNEIPDVWRPFPWTFYADDNKTPCDLTSFHWQRPGGAEPISLIACSLRSDRALAVGRTGGWPTELWVIRISTGRVVQHRTYPDDTLGDIVASPDGTLIAEVARQPGPAVLRRVSDWRTVATLAGPTRVLGFTADDSRVVAVKEPPIFPGDLTTQVVDLASNKIVWQNVGNEEAMSLIAHTGTGDLVLALRFPASPSCPIATSCFLFFNSRLVIVHRDGSATNLDGRYLTDW